MTGPGLANRRKVVTGIVASACLALSACDPRERRHLPERLGLKVVIQDGPFLVPPGPRRGFSFVVRHANAVRVVVADVTNGPPSFRVGLFRKGPDDYLSDPVPEWQAVATDRYEHQGWLPPAEYGVFIENTAKGGPTMKVRLQIVLNP